MAPKGPYKRQLMPGGRPAVGAEVPLKAAIARRGPGRPPKQKDEVKDALMQAFEGLGGVMGLIHWAEDNQTDFYKLWIRMMPHEIREKTVQTARNQGSEIKIEFVSRDGGKTTGTRVTMGSGDTAEQYSEESAGEDPGEAPGESIPEVLPPLPAPTEISNVVRLMERSRDGEEEIARASGEYAEVAASADIPSA